VRLVQWETDRGEHPVQGVLRGLNTSDVEMDSLRGGWTLLHFWATWCAPCIRHMPDIRELAREKGLTVAAIGFADSNDRLAAAGAQEKDLKVFAPDAGLQRELAITSIPIDALLDPQGKPVFVVSGDMAGEQFKAVVRDYVGK
jgi:thiol-disulfide isomerase/thioredoxin